jgi:non-heme chloroperoxidase
VNEAFELTGAVLIGPSMARGEIVRYLTRHGASRDAKIVLLAPTKPCLAHPPDNPNGVYPAIVEAVRGTWRKNFHKWIATTPRPSSRPRGRPRSSA